MIIIKIRFMNLYSAWIYVYFNVVEAFFFFCLVLCYSCSFFCIAVHIVDHNPFLGKFECDCTHVCPMLFTPWISHLARFDCFISNILNTAITDVISYWRKIHCFTINVSTSEFWYLQKISLSSSLSYDCFS